MKGEYKVKISKKTLNIIEIIILFGVIFALSIGNILSADLEYSKSERRKLMQLSGVTSSENISDSFEEYSLDQFIYRDKFRTLKSFVSFYILGQSDNNDIYIYNDQAVKIDKEINVESLNNFNSKVGNIHKMVSKYIDTDNMYFVLAPDKNMYLGENSNHPYVKYDEILSMIDVGTVNKIGIYNSIDSEGFYNTDLHWKQESLQTVKDKILSEMGMESSWNYTEKAKTDKFYGVYYGQSALPLSPEPLVYMSNTNTENATVFDYELNKEVGMYDLSPNLDDEYSTFLYGPKSMLKITKAGVDEPKNRLIMFRDSFGSTLAPLMIDEFDEIYVLDTRYMNPILMEKMVDFGSDIDTKVLFLYSFGIINDSIMLK